MPATCRLNVAKIAGQQRARTSPRFGREADEGSPEAIRERRMRMHLACSGSDERLPHLPITQVHLCRSVYRAMADSSGPAVPHARVACESTFKSGLIWADAGRSLARTKLTKCGPIRAPDPVSMFDTDVGRGRPNFGKAWALEPGTHVPHFVLASSRNGFCSELPEGQRYATWSTLPTAISIKYAFGQFRPQENLTYHISGRETAVSPCEQVRGSTPNSKPEFKMLP